MSDALKLVTDTDGKLMIDAVSGKVIASVNDDDECPDCDCDDTVSPVTGCQIERGYFGNMTYGPSINRKATPEWVKVANIDSLFTGFDASDPAEFVDFGPEWPHDYPPFVAGDGKVNGFCRPMRIPACSKPLLGPDGFSDPIWRKHVCGYHTWDGVLQCRRPTSIYVDYVIWGGYKLPTDIPSVYGVRGGSLDISIVGAALNGFTDGSAELNYFPEGQGNPFTIADDGTSVPTATAGFGYWTLDVPIDTWQMYKSGGDGPSPANPYGTPWMLAGRPASFFLGRYFKVCQSEADTRPAGDYTAILANPGGVRSPLASRHGYGDYGTFGWGEEFVGIAATVPVSWSQTATIAELAERPAGSPFSSKPLKLYKKPAGECGGAGGTTTIPTTGNDGKRYCWWSYLYQFECNSSTVWTDVFRQSVICSAENLPTGWQRTTKQVTGDTYTIVSFRQWVRGPECGSGGGDIEGPGGSTVCGDCTFGNSSTADIAFLVPGSPYGYTIIGSGLAFDKTNCTFKGPGVLAYASGTPVDSDITLSFDGSNWTITTSAGTVSAPGTCDGITHDDDGGVTEDGSGGSGNTITVSNSGGDVVGDGGAVNCNTTPPPADPAPPTPEEIAAFCEAA